MQVGDRVIIIPEGRSGTITAVAEDGYVVELAVGKGPVTVTDGLRLANTNETGANDARDR